MNKLGVITCAECVNKTFHGFDYLGRKRYYCSKVDGIVRQGLVLDTTDASACIKWGLFNGLEKRKNEEDL